MTLEAIILDEVISQMLFEFTRSCRELGQDEAGAMALKLSRSHRVKALELRGRLAALTER